MPHGVPAARSAAGPARFARLRRRAGHGALLLGALVLVATWASILAFSEVVRILARRNDPRDEAEARRLRDPRDDVAEVYGIPEGDPVRVVFPDPAARIDPVEAPGTVL